MYSVYARVCLVVFKTAAVGTRRTFVVVAYDLAVTVH